MPCQPPITFTWIGQWEGPEVYGEEANYANDAVSSISVVASSGLLATHY